MDTIRTRFAPSPTGYLHVGGPARPFSTGCMPVTPRVNSFYASKTPIKSAMSPTLRKTLSSDPVPSSPSRSLDQDSVFIRLRLSRRIRRRLDALKNRPAAVPHGSLDIRLDLTGTDVTPVDIVQEIMAHGNARSRPNPS